MAGELVQQDGDAVDGAAALEMRLDLLGRGGVVDVPDEDAPRVDVLLVLPQVVALLVQRRLHLAKLGCLFFHLCDPPLHCGNLIFLCRGSVRRPGRPGVVAYLVVTLVLNRHRLLLNLRLGIRHPGLP